MKRFLLILAVVGVIQIASTVYYDTKRLAQPIAVAGMIDLASKNIKFSYITNTIEPHEFYSIEFNGHHYYPEQPFSMFAQEPQLETYVKYTYYSMISPVIWLYEQDDLSPLKGATKGTIHFKDGSTAMITLTTNEYVEIPHPQLQSLSSSVGTDGASEFYKVLTPITLKQVNVVDHRVDILNLKVNGKELQLPLTTPLQLNKEDRLYIATTDGEAQYEMELFKVELHIVDSEQQESILTMSQFLNTRPSEDWVTSIVKERGEL